MLVRCTANLAKLKRLFDRERWRAGAAVLQSAFQCVAPKIREFIRAPLGNEHHRVSLNAGIVLGVLFLTGGDVMHGVAGQKRCD